jgi:hypothetical protein
VLDYTLQDGECLTLIVVLQEQQVPIIIHSGWPPRGAGIPPEISELPWVSKPTDCNVLLGALVQAVPGLVVSESFEPTGTSRHC